MTEHPIPKEGDELIAYEIAKKIFNLNRIDLECANFSEVFLENYPAFQRNYITFTIEKLQQMNCKPIAIVESKWMTKTFGRQVAISLLSTEDHSTMISVSIYSSS